MKRIRAVQALVIIIMLVFITINNITSPLYGDNNNIKTDSVTVQEGGTESDDDISPSTENNENAIVSSPYLYEELKTEIDIAVENMNMELEQINSIEDKKEFFVAYKEIMDRYSDILDVPETVYDCYSAAEIATFQRLLAAETTGGDFESKCNVASVVWNRLESNDYPNTITDVIFEKNGSIQFTPVADGRMWRVSVTEDDILAIEYTFLFGSTAYDCIAFDNMKNSWSRRHLEYVFTDSVGHSFYR